MFHNLVTFNFLRSNAQEKERHSEMDLEGRVAVDGNRGLMSAHHILYLRATFPPQIDFYIYFKFCISEITEQALILRKIYTKIFLVNVAYFSKMLLSSKCHNYYLFLS